MFVQRNILASTEAKTRLVAETPDRRDVTGGLVAARRLSAAG